MHQSYFEGIVGQVRLLHDGATFPHIEQHLEMRRKTIGVYPAIAMVACVLPLFELAGHDFADEVLQSRL